MWSGDGEREPSRGGNPAERNEAPPEKNTPHNKTSATQFPRAAALAARTSTHSAAAAAAAAAAAQKPTPLPPSLAVGR